MRDSRRRRLMFRDENDVGTNQLHSLEDPKKTSRKSSSRSQYTAGARVENQPKLIDFVPTRLSMVTGLCLVVVTVAGLLNFAHFRILPFASEKGIPAGSLELSLDRGLFTWVVSFLLLASAFFCFQVFQVRRHRADDFSGSFRVWIWLAGCFVLASIDSSARIGPIAASLISANWENGVLSSERNVWYLLVGIPVIVVCVRLMFELGRSKIATGSIVIAGLAYVFANTIRLDLFSIPQQNYAMLEANAVLVACSFMFFTVVWFARYVVLESRGVITGAVHPAAINASSQLVIDSRPDTVGKEAEAGKHQSHSESPGSIEADLNRDDEVDSAHREQEPALEFMGHKIERKKERNRRKRNSHHDSRKKAA